MNEYKQWPTDKLIAEGKRLKSLLDIAPDEVKAMPDRTPHELLRKQRAMNIIYRGEITLKALRNEYIYRKSKQSQTDGKNTNHSH